MINRFYSGKYPGKNDKAYMSYVMSIKPDASLTWNGNAAQAATVFGIILCTLYYVKMQKKVKA